jgi:glycosyltransferase involved in cell wall biosynthesis
MILIDAVFINNGGGKILLEYLISEIEKTGINATYLLDNRYQGILPKHSKNILWIEPSIYKRHIFYLKNKNSFKKILCFGNIPPTVRTNSLVFTYFHQFLFLVKLDFFKPKNYLIYLKRLTIKLLKNNTNFWIVQNKLVCDNLSNFLSNKLNNVLIIPFYRSLKIDNNSIKKKKQLLYVSNGEVHKNHLLLINAFKLFYDKYKIGELHLTIPSNYKSILEKLSNDYPIINHSNLNDNELKNLYHESEFFIFPSIYESFGLGIVEAIECGCKVIGSDLPFLYQICVPTDVFDPFSINSILKSIENAYFSKTNLSHLKVSNDIKQLLNILKTE